MVVILWSCLAIGTTLHFVNRCLIILQWVQKDGLFSYSVFWMNVLMVGNLKRTSLISSKEASTSTRAQANEIDPFDVVRWSVQWGNQPWTEFSLKLGDSIAQGEGFRA